MSLRSLAPLFCLWPALVVGQVTIGPEGPKSPAPPPGEPQPPPPNSPQVYRLQVTPAAEPVLALKYRFDVPPADRMPGNSVPFYYRALIVYQQRSSDLKKRLDDLDSETADLPLEQFPVEKARALVGEFSSILHELERASTREETDWGWRLEQLGGLEGIEFLLPEIQESRALARLLRIKARLEIVEGRYDDAEHTLRVGYALGHAVAEPPILICGLVGVAISSVMDVVVLDWINQPGSPNVYWAITALPDPPIDLRPALEYELAFPSRFAPWLETVETDDVPPAVWKHRVEKLFGDLRGFSDTAAPPEVTSLILAGIALREYPKSKRALIEIGFDAARVAAMPVGQVLAIRQKHVDDLIADELLKEAFVSSEHAADVGESAEHSLKARGHFGPPPLQAAEPLPLMTLLAPATRPAMQAALRLQTRHAALRAVEAIRQHVAATGTLPQSLDEIISVPVPVNPSDGKPFAYRVDGETAVLEANVRGGHPAGNWRLEITLAEQSKQK